MSGETRRAAVRGCCVVTVGAMLVLACNQRHPLEDHIAPSQPSTIIPAPAPLPSSISTLSGVSVVPRGMLGGNAGRGTVLLTLPAPAGGTIVSLSTSDAAVSVPPVVTIAEGRESAEFFLTTSAVAADRQATIVAAVPERNANASLLLWTLEPTFLAFGNDPSPPPGLGIDATRRVLPPSAAFTAFCSGSEIEIRISEGSRDSWSAIFGAPQRRPLAVGTYDVPSSRMSLGGTGIGCSQGLVGQFTVREAGLAANGRVDRFWAAFDVHCGSPTGTATHGDVRVTNVGTGFPLTNFQCTVR
jgi:hypothetical protein